MVHTFKKLAVAGILSIAAVSAVQAQDFGPYTTSQSIDFIRLTADADSVKTSGPSNVRGAYFDDTYQINLTQISDFSYSISEITAGNNAQYDVTFLNFGFFDANGDEVSTFTNLAAGTYFLTAGGKLAGSLGGDFNVSFNISPVAQVPEADTYAMLLAGLGFMGFVGRRKTK